MRGLKDLINLFLKNKLRRIDKAMFIAYFYSKFFTRQQRDREKIKKIKGDVYGYLNEV